MGDKDSIIGWMINIELINFVRSSIATDKNIFGKNIMTNKFLRQIEILKINGDTFWTDYIYSLNYKRDPSIGDFL